VSPARRSADATSALREALVGHALRIVHRDGANALTMRALAAEADCAVGLPYKVFGGRGELVTAVLTEQFRELGEALEEVVAAAGTGTVGDNLVRFAEVLLGSDTEVIKLAEVHRDPQLSGHMAESALVSGFVGRLTTAVDRYLTAEQGRGRVSARVDPAAVGFVVTGAVHNLLVSGEAYPRPSLADVAAHLRAVAELLVADG
jgi:AcrR family transcriptional regulator